VLFPPALAAAGARQLYAGRALAALPYLAALLAAAALCGWLAYRVALRTALSGGEEGRARARTGGGWLARRLSEWLGPLAEKELHYLARHPAVRVAALVVPALAGLVAWKVLPQLPEEAGEVVRALPLFAVAAYVHLVLQVFWLNAFGWDGGGARVLFLAPLSPAAVLAAKNGASILTAALLFLLAGAVYVSAGTLPPAWALAAALLLHLGMAPWLHAVGNLVSVANPRAARFALQNRGSLPALSALGGMAITAGGTGLFGLPVLAALHWESEWVLLGAWAALGALGWAAWRWSLPHAGALLVRRREVVLAEVTGESA
jgi:ABC-2 type transport system permease protein